MNPTTNTEAGAVADVAAKLTEAQRNILDRLATGLRLGLADREDDRARQSLRKQGLIAYCGKPLRWQLSSKGLALAQHLEQGATAGVVGGKEAAGG